MVFEYVRTDWGIKVAHHGNLVGWLTRRMNQQYGFIPVPAPSSFKSPSFNSIDEAKDGFRRYMANNP